MCIQSSPSSLSSPTSKSESDAIATKHCENLAERSGVDDLRSLVAMLIQTDKFGTSIAKGLRVFSDSLRTKRRQRAEQEAQKAAVKLLLPLALFLFPTLFIAILGPAALNLYDVLGKM